MAGVVAQVKREHETEVCIQLRDNYISELLGYLRQGWLHIFLNLFCWAVMSYSLQVLGNRRT